jgi:hypothetical protein
MKGKHLTKLSIKEFRKEQMKRNMCVQECVDCIRFVIDDVGYYKEKHGIFN